MKKKLLILVILFTFGITASAQYTFYISSGKFVGGGIDVKGYSGRKINDDGYNYQNRPEQTQAKNLGAIPTGTYYITGVNSSIGPNTIILTKDSENDMYGRDGFRIHGNNSDGNASRGCIILPASERQMIVNAYNNWVNGGKKDAILSVYVAE